jgi:alpha-ketoglutarate-dependent taurine dioxygenase
VSNMSSVQIKQVGPGYICEVSELDISKHLMPNNVATIIAGMVAQAVLIFRGQSLTSNKQLAFTNALGRLEDVVATSLPDDDDNRLPAGLAEVSNLDKDNQQTTHRPRPYPHNEARGMRRTTLASAAPTIDQQSA